MDEGPAVSTCTQEAHRRGPKLQPSTWPRLEPASGISSAERGYWRELGLILVLLIFAGAVRFWLIARTEVLARDGIGFIRYALQLENQPWADVVHGNLQHPGYPLLLMLVSWPVRYFTGTTDCLSMQLSAQLTSALAGLLLVIPMYFLGRDLLNRQAGFWGAALFQCLPVSSRVMSDALSEACFLLFCATSLVFAVRALRQRSLVGFLLCGIFGGLAYLVRPEGALVVAATALVLLGIQFYRPWRWTIGRSVACGLSLGIGALLAGGPYVLATGSITNKPTPLRMLQSAQTRGGPADRSSSDQKEPLSAARGDGPLLATIFGVYLEDRGWWTALQAVGTEVTKGYLYVIGIPVLLGMWWFRSCLRTVPGAWVLLVLGLLHTLILLRLAMVVGYVSDRHVLLLVMCGVFTAAAATAKMGAWLGIHGYHLVAGASASMQQVAWAGIWGSTLLLLVQTGFGFPESIKPLHLNRAGHREAGRWLVEHANLADPVEDPFCWAHFYANRVFWEGKTPPSPPGYQPTRYVVIEHSDHDHTRLPMIKRAEALSQEGKPVYWWPASRPEADAKVVVYAVPPADRR